MRDNQVGFYVHILLDHPVLSPLSRNFSTHATARLGALPNLNNIEALTTKQQRLIKGKTYQKVKL